MFSERAFFSFVEITDPDGHRTYNEWHQLDHRPENLLLPGVAWGDRWARTADCAGVGGPVDGGLAAVDYVAMYWFRPPYDESIAAWTKLGEDSFQWGRGPLMSFVRRPLTAFFTPVKGYVAPRVPVSADALPFRPNRGLHVTLSRLPDAHGAAAHETFRWQDRVRIPDLLDVPGVAGAWTFALHGLQRHPSLPFTEDGAEPDRGSLRIRLLYLDDDPVDVAGEIAQREQGWAAAGRGTPAPEAEQVLLSSPVRTITPWQDW